MKQTVNYYAFVDAFNRMGRSEQFSYSALKALFEYLEDVCEGDYDLDAVLYVDSHNEAHMMVYDATINGNCEDTVGEWKKVQSIDGIKGYTATKDGFYSVI